MATRIYLIYKHRLRYVELISKFQNLLSFCNFLHILKHDRDEVAAAASNIDGDVPQGEVSHILDVPRGHHGPVGHLHPGLDLETGEVRVAPTGIVSAETKNLSNCICNRRTT